MSQFHSPHPEPGTARLSVVIIAAIASFLIFAVLEYCLPLYFNAIEGLPRDVWSQLALWQVIPWIFTPALAGLLSRRFGERRVWGAALIGQSIVPMILWIWPEPWVVRPLAFWYGFTNALMWVGGVSLAQVVPQEKKGLANGLMMIALGIGSLFGPLIGRILLWRQFVADLIGNKNSFLQFGEFLINLQPPPSDPPLANFQTLFVGLTIWAMLTAAVVWCFSQRAGRLAGEDEAHTASQALQDLRQLVCNSRFWALTISLCLLGGPVFQATNQFLKYRAEDVHLIVGSQDRGWILLQLLRMAMWIPGGIAVGLLAGRRSSGFTGVATLVIFSLSGLAIGLAQTSAGLFVAVALFEFVRQIMRWSHSGYLSEHMPLELRAIAIGCSVSMAGIGATLFGLLPLPALNASATEFSSALPFYIATAFGLMGAAGLFIFDRFLPIRSAIQLRRSPITTSSIKEVTTS